MSAPRKVIRAEVLGFCMGVRRAVETARSALAESAGTYPVYTLGPLIHNPQVLESLAAQGMQILEEASLFGNNPPVLSGAAIIIRAHGVGPKTEQLIRERGGRIIDATCPHVKASQLTAQKKAEQGNIVFLAGEREHAEIRGINGYAPCIIVGNPEEAENAARALYKKEPAARTALIGQTTISEDEYTAIAKAIKIFFDLEVINTICGATRDRQNALRELCAKVDGVIIAGGRDSANTRRLFSIAQNCGKKAWLVENINALPPLDTLPELLGISAGASTPGSVIDEIERALCSFS